MVNRSVDNRPEPSALLFDEHEPDEAAFLVETVETECSVAEARLSLACDRLDEVARG